MVTGSPYPGANRHCAETHFSGVELGLAPRFRRGFRDRSIRRRPNQAAPEESPSPFDLVPAGRRFQGIDILREEPRQKSQMTWRT